MNSATLSEILHNQKENFKIKDPGTPRQIFHKALLESPQIIVISGVRRSGKSTLLRQISEHLDGYCFLNLDDERLVSLQLSDLAEIMMIWQKDGISKHILLDEIQNIDGWERFVRRIHDEGYKVILTGSNARLLSSDLATHLTGRYTSVELFPFSFMEYLVHSKIAHASIHTTAQKAKIIHAFDDYVQGGGFPYYCTYHDKDFLSTLYENILYKDIIFRCTIREKKAFRELAQYIFSNVSGEISYLKLKNLLGFKSQTSVKNYISFMEEAYLIFQLSKYDYSLKKQYVSNKKIYVIDNGLRNAVAFSFAPDKGQLLENLVFLELKRRQQDIYYHKGKRECDFILKQGGKITTAIQVSDHISSQNEQREVQGLMEALDCYSLQEGRILTYQQEDALMLHHKKIEILPIWKWLLMRD